MKLKSKLIWFATSASLPLGSVALAQEVTGYELKPNYNVRSEPTLEAQVNDKVRNINGETLQFENVPGHPDWLKVTRPNGGTGYVKADVRQQVQLNSTFIVRENPSLVTGKRIELIGQGKQELLTGESKIVKEDGKTIEWKGILVDGKHAWVASTVTKPKLPTAPPVPPTRPNDVKSAAPNGAPAPKSALKAEPKSAPKAEKPAPQPARRDEAPPMPPRKPVSAKAVKPATPVSDKAAPAVEKLVAAAPKTTPVKPGKTPQKLATVVQEESQKTKVKADATRPAKPAAPVAKPAPSELAKKLALSKPIVVAKDETKKQTNQDDEVGAPAAPEKPKSAPVKRKLGEAKPVSVAAKPADDEAQAPRPPAEIPGHPDAAPQAPKPQMTAKPAAPKRRLEECVKTKEDFEASPHLQQVYGGQDMFAPWQGKYHFLGIFPKHVAVLNYRGNGVWQCTLDEDVRDRALSEHGIHPVTNMNIEICTNAKNQRYIIFAGKRVQFNDASASSVDLAQGASQNDDDKMSATFTRGTDQ